MSSAVMAVDSPLPYYFLRMHGYKCTLRTLRNNEFLVYKDNQRLSNRHKTLTLT